MKRFVMAITLTCALSTSALAGNIPTDGVASPTPPPPPGAAQVANAKGDIPSVPGEVPTGGWAQKMTEEFLLAIFGIFAR